MERYVLDQFEAKLTFDKVQAKLKLTEEDDIELVLPKFEEAQKIARPKAVYKVCYVDAIQGDAVTVDGMEFHSDILAKNLDGLHRVFAYVLTCGTEVDDWSHQEPDPIMGLWLDMIKELIMFDAREQFFAMLREKYGIEKMSTMNPGSGNVDVWPIRQQTPLFELIGDVHRDTGVTLHDSMLMTPTKSVSGIAFPSDKEYVNCAYCMREDCVGRRAPYSPNIL